MVDVLHGDVTVVFDVLHLLTVTVRLLQGLDDQSRGRGADSDLGEIIEKLTESEKSSPAPVCSARSTAR